MDFNWTLIPSGIILSISDVYVIGKILNESFFKNKIVKYIMLIFLVSIYFIVSYLLLNKSLIRYMLYIALTSFSISKIYNKNFNESLVATFFSWLLTALSELIFAIIVEFIFKLKMSSFFGLLIGNIGVSLILCGLININFINKVSKKTINKFSDIKGNYKIVLIFVLALAISIIIYINYFDMEAYIKIFFSITVIIIYTIITINLLSEKNENLKMQCKYESINQNLNEYEKMIEYQRISNHENKNQLLVIKGMIEKKDKKVNEYINSIIKEYHEPSENFLYQTNKIPSGGLRGLIYYKCLLMKDKNINIDINVNNDVRKINFDKLNINLNKDICKIVGVLIDNAIEAVENIKQKNIDINLSYTNKEFKIQISNNYNGSLDLSLIDKKGYTTKGSGHGYGLSLVKEIINKNSNIKNNREIKGNVFIQNVKIYI